MVNERVGAVLNLNAVKVDVVHRVLKNDGTQNVTNNEDRYVNNTFRDGRVIGVSQKFQNVVDHDGSGELEKIRDGGKNTGCKEERSEVFFEGGQYFFGFGVLPTVEDVGELLIRVHGLFFFLEVGKVFHVEMFL